MILLRPNSVCYSFIVCGLCLLMGCGGLSTQRNDVAKKTPNRDDKVRDGMNVAEVAEVLGAPDTCFWTKDSIWLQLYYRENDNRSARTSVVLFSGRREVIYAAIYNRIFFDNSGPDADRDTTIYINKEQRAYTDNAGDFVFRTYMTGWDRINARQKGTNLHMYETSDGCVDSIQVFVNKDRYVQTIVPAENDNYPGNVSPLELEDMNFDGIKDIGIIEFLPAGPNIPHLYWVYNQVTKKYERSEGLEHISSAEVDNEKEEIVSFWRDGAAHHGISTYKYINGTPTLVKVVEEYNDNEDRFVHVEMQRVKGEMKVVVKRFIDTPEL